MVDLDLDILAGKKKIVKIGGQELELKDLTVAEHLDNEVLAAQIDNMPLVDRESVKDAVAHIKKYIMAIIDIDEEMADKITIEQYKAIRKYLARKDMYDQGFSDRDIDMMEKKALKNQMAQLK